MLFQNKEKVEDAPGEDALTVMPKETKEKGVPRSLEHIVPCQVLMKSGKLGKRGEIPADFQPSADTADSEISSVTSTKYLIWSAIRSKNLFTGSCY